MKTNIAYLDAAATANRSRVDDIIIDTITKAMTECWQNPSSLYANRVKEEINRCRANIAKFIGAKSEEIYFTSGASESNNWVIRGWSDYVTSPFKNIITTPIEHKSILEAVNNKALQCFRYYCDVDEFGFVDCQSLEAILRECLHHPKLIIIGFANNEIGTLQPIKEISDLVHKYGGVLHIDATQAVGHVPIDVDELGIDMLSASGHKISPVLKGIGFLYKKSSINIQPLIYGSQELGLRGGTENTFGIIGLSKAVDLCDVSHNKINEMCDKRDYLINLLETKFDCDLNGDSYYRLPNNINVILPAGVSGESILYMLSMSNIFISTASACNSNSIVPSVVLKGIGLSNEEAMRSIRITISENTTYEEIDYFISELDKAIKLITI